MFSVIPLLPPFTLAPWMKTKFRHFLFSPNILPLSFLFLAWCILPQKWPITKADFDTDMKSRAACPCPIECERYRLWHMSTRRHSIDTVAFIVRAIISPVQRVREVASERERETSVVYVELHNNGGNCVCHDVTVRAKLCIQLFLPSHLSCLF